MVKNQKVILAYLKKLAIDEKHTCFTFQTFDDCQVKRHTKRPELTKTFNCESIVEVVKVLPALERLNKQGAGIYVTVQQTDGHGRKKENITRLRAIFQEDDHGHGQPDIELKPHMVIESSPGKYHRYYLVRSDDLDQLDRFAPIMQTMVERFGSDPGAKDLSRVLRVPGFLHLKDPGNPFVVKVTAVNPHEPYTLEEIEKVRHIDYSSIDDLFLIDDKPDDQVVEVATVKAALDHIDPDDKGYDHWLEVGMCLHHLSNGSNEGLKLYDEWSQASAHYDYDEILYKWGSYKRKPGEPLKTVKSIYRLAYAGGWDGLPRIDNKANRALLYEQNKRILERFQDEYRLCQIGSDVFFVTRKVNQRGCIDTRFIKVRALRDFIELKIYYTEKKKDGYELKKKSIVDYILAGDDPAIKRYNDVCFNPQAAMTQTESLPAGECYNIYTGLVKEPMAGDWSLCYKHIKDIMCNGDKEHFDYFLNFLAHLIQRPEKIPGVVPVFKSGQGAGKQIVLNSIVEMFGNAGEVITDREEITGQFNAGITNKLILLLDEAVFSGDNRARSVLKSQITNKHIRVNEKMLPRYTVKNYSRLLFTTNEDWAAPVEKGDRRYFVVNMNEKYSYQNDHPERTQYFNAILEEIASGGIEAMFYDLSQRDISGFNSYEMPKTLASIKLEMYLKTTKNNHEQFLYECLRDGEFPDVDGFMPVQVNDKVNWKDNSILIDMTAFFNAYKVYRQSIAPVRRSDTPLTQKRLTREVRKLIKLKKQKGSVYRIQSDLYHSRQNFCKAIGYYHDWKEDIDLEEKEVNIDELLS